jgi:hypothetical protein
LVKSFTADRTPSKRSFNTQQQDSEFYNIIIALST